MNKVVMPFVARWLFSGLLIFLFFPLCGQGLYSHLPPPSLSDLSQYQNLLTQKRQCQLQVMQAAERVEQSNISQNGKFWLKSALQQMLDSRKPALAEKLQRLQPHIDWEGLPTNRLLELESRLISINRQLQRLKTIYRYAGDRMADYPAAPEAEIKEELTFYGIQAGERIGEIGAGGESFAAAVLSIRKPRVYYLNDVDSLALLQIAFHRGYNPVFRKASTPIIPVLGTEGCTGLEGKALDKIIVRNAFHHFKRPQEMLHSIKQSLAQDGKLFLRERYLENCGDQCCENTMSRSAIAVEMREAGFELLEKNVLEDRYGMKSHLLEYAPVHQN